MRQTFDRKVSRAEQLIRSGNRKKVGRKHNKTLSRSKANLRAQRRAEFIHKKMMKALKRYGAEVEKYWKGLRDTFPKRPSRK